MLSLADGVVVLFLAYYLTGLNMVLFHSALGPADQPGYVRMGTVRRFLAGAMWPIVGRANHELGWYAVTFIAAFFVIAIEYWIVGKFLTTSFWQTGIVWIACITPIVNLPLALVSAVLWLIVAKPLGLRVPTGMGRVARV